MAVCPMESSDHQLGQNGLGMKEGEPHRSGWCFRVPNPAANQDMAHIRQSELELMQHMTSWQTLGLLDGMEDFREVLKLGELVDEMFGKDDLIISQ